jgi:multidrug efflux pump subunit AcrB
MKSSFFPIVTVSSLMAEITVYDGTPFASNEAILKQLDNAATALRKELNEDDTRPDGGRVESTTYGSSVRVSLELLDTEDYDTPTRELRDRWIELIGELPEVKEFDIRYTMFDMGKPIQLELAAEDLDSLKSASIELREELSRYPGVFNVRNSLETPVPELRLQLKPHAEALGISLNDVARQVRQGFYGEEVQRIPRKREDVKVMVRYSEDERQSIEDLRNMRIRTSSGEEIPFDAVASYEYAPSYSKIDHLDRKRTATVTADLQQGYSPRPIIGQLLAKNEARWKSQYPGLDVRKSGETEQESEFVSRSIQLTTTSLIIIYGLFAIVLRSWGQPSLVVSAIPFGFAGAMIGHMLFGQEITMFSILGIIAVAGVVVNDNLVMIDRINELRNEGMAYAKAISQGATDRFRPIILTSVTTFISLVPVMMETNVQARFLLPMVLSLAFGILLSTFVTLLFVPSLYFFGLSAKQRLGRGAENTAPEPQVT